MSKLDEKLKKLAGENAIGSAVTTAKKQRVIGRPFKPGQSGNPAGRPPGRPNYITEMNRGIEKLAKENKMSVAELKVRLYAKGFKLASEGDYQFFRDFLDRTHGKPIQPIAGPDDDDGNQTPIRISIDI